MGKYVDNPSRSASILLQNAGQEVKKSKLITAVDKALAKHENTALSSDIQFGFTALLQTPGVVLNCNEFDMEFEIPFDDDTVANEAEFVVYNLSDSTANKFKIGGSIAMTAGYGSDTGVIFEGYISKVKTIREGVDRITTIYALDDVKYTPQMLEELTFAENTNASTILKSLLSRLNLPIEVFAPKRDFTYDSETKIDGSIVEAIKEYSDVCGVSTYIYKQRIYCRPLTDGDNLHFNINSDTGMIGSPEPFEEENTSEKYVDTVHGYNITMILQHRMGTAGIVNVNSLNYSGQYRVSSGTHSYDGLSATTEIKCIEKVSTVIDESKTSSSKSDSSSSSGSSSGNSAVEKAVSWALSIAKDSSHGYDQNSRWGPDYDCSSLVITAWQKAGVGVKSAGATYTGNMRAAFLKCGFKDVTGSVNRSTGAGIKRGDVLLNTAKHTAMAISSSQIVHASINERGGITGGKRGDQTGKEICTRSYYNKPWDYVLRYKG